jgi:hypothetical protein
MQGLMLAWVSVMVNQIYNDHWDLLWNSNITFIALPISH